MALYNVCDPLHMFPEQECDISTHQTDSYTFEEFSHGVPELRDSTIPSPVVQQHFLSHNVTSKDPLGSACILQKSMVVPMSINSVSTLYSIDTTIVPHLRNIVSTVNLGCKLDLNKIVRYSWNAEYNPKLYAAVIMRIRKPQATAHIFSSGKMICNGAQTEQDSKVASRKFARIVQKLGFNVKFVDFKIQNMIACCNVRFRIQLDSLARTHSHVSIYDPELFRGVIFHMAKPRMVLYIFSNGKVVLTGGKTQQDIDKACITIYPILKEFQKY